MRHIKTGPPKNRRLTPSSIVLTAQIQGTIAREYRKTNTRYKDLIKSFEQSVTDWPGFLKRWGKYRENAAQRWGVKGNKELTALLSAVYSEGYLEGRRIECGNLYQRFRYTAYRLREVCDNEFGPRPGLPTPEQVALHRERHLVGFWMLAINIREQGMTMCRVATLAVNAAGELCEQNTNLRKLTPDEIERVVSSHPVDLSGIPCGWPEIAGAAPLKRKRRAVPRPKSV